MSGNRGPRSEAVGFTQSRLGRALVAHPVLALTIGAVALRLLMFLGRGHYVAFDEGWYLLLGRNFWSGQGYSLSGLEHVALSPLFPILAGALDRVLHDAVWAGRLVTALAAGLLVVPCWSIFERLGGRKVALLGALYVAVMPSLAPFVVPYWIGWDLWVGAEPLLHLFLFAGIALFLRAWERGSAASAAGCGAMLGLAYLSRPEAILVFGLLGILAVGTAAALRTLRARALPIALCALAFVVVAAPYWLYLHDTLGRWAISGRGVQVVAPAAAPGAGQGGAAPSTGIERMLWSDDDDYARSLYALDAGGTALASSYWGVRPAEEDAASPTPPNPASRAGSEVDTPAAPEAPAATPTAPAPAPPPGAREAPGALGLYVRALGVVVPWFVWPFAIFGLIAPRAAPWSRRLEALFAVPLAATSAVIAVVVATDPRTQLFVAPLVAFYAARGCIAAAGALEQRVGPELRRDVALGLVAGTLAVVMLGMSARRLYLSVAVGSPHHIVAAENAIVGDALRRTMPGHATVMSWHPALALFADRDWRVLPLEPMDRIVRWATTQPDPFIVLSVFYPPPILQGDEAPHYLVVPVPADTPASDAWRIDIAARTPVYATGILRATDARATSGTP